jgi:hypothetical protein
LLKRQRLPQLQKHRSPWLALLAIAWILGVGWGLSVLWAYENRPGTAAHAPARWPDQSALAPALDRPTMIFLAHPKCDCTRASIGELAQILARAPKAPKVYVLVLRPAGFADGWEKTDIWKSAAALPNVSVLRDEDGVEARRFGVETSGQTLLYDRQGSLVFSGGITGARGHAGDNAGESALVTLLTGGTPDRHGTSVFGCPLF